MTLWAGRMGTAGLDKSRAGVAGANKEQCSPLPLNFPASVLNMELDLQSLFMLLCTAVLIGLRARNPPPLPPNAFGLIYEGAIGQPR